MNKALIAVGALVVIVLALPLLANLSGGEAESEADTAPPADPNAPPAVVSIKPANRARDVDPNLTELRVRFNVPMAAGFSWTGGPPDFPDTPAGSKARWVDERTCVLPVALQPGRTYKLGLNAPCCQNFRSQAGIALDWTRWEFTTRSR